MSLRQVTDVVQNCAFHSPHVRSTTWLLSVGSFGALVVEGAHICSVSVSSSGSLD